MFETTAAVVSCTRPIRLTYWTASLAISLLALSGCTSMKVRMGWKVYLEKTPIASIKVSLPKGPGIGREKSCRW
ncbi:MAG TPA: hypothetical protein VFA74_19610 [Terriglobales bacterium]|nr:hypothetical protein [Terriglobales bacterium]